MMLKRMIRTLVVAVVGATMVSSGAVADTKVLMDYWNSNDGDTGGYVEIGYTLSSISDFKDKWKSDSVLNGDHGSTSSWDSGTFKGAKLQIGNDFGKLRFDVKMAGGYGNIDSIGGVAADKTNGAINQGAFAALSLNLYWDIYRLDLGQYGAKSGFFNVALTPYIGAGFGAAGVALRGETTSSNAGRDHALSGGPMHSYTAGLLLEVTESVGMTVAYNHTEVSGIGRRNLTGTDDHTNKAFEAGLRVTF